MSQGSSKSQVDDLPLSIISKLSGGRIPLLPGESADEYRNGLDATITELDAKTPMQVYLAEKIFDCMWWIRRLEMRKYDKIVRSVWGVFQAEYKQPPELSLVASGDFSNPELIEHASGLGETVESLFQNAITENIGVMRAIDGLIADRLKAMQGFQAAYEALVNRKLIIERLRLQNENLRRNVNAIEMQALTQATTDDRETDDQ